MLSGFNLTQKKKKPTNPKRLNLIYAKKDPEKGHPCGLNLRKKQSTHKP